MPRFTNNLHKTILPRTINRSHGLGDTIKPFLNINPRQTNGIEILDFIKRCHNRSIIALSQQLKGMRWKYKSNTIVFHTIEGGAIPTPTHHDIILIRD